VDERYPLTEWPLGRVLEIHPGKDGKTRVVTVRTRTSTLTRPIVKLCLFPIDDNKGVYSLMCINEGGRNVRKVASYG